MELRPSHYLYSTHEFVEEFILIYCFKYILIYCNNLLSGRAPCNFHRRGQSLYPAKTLDFDIDYKRLLSLFAAKGRLNRAFYYTALMKDQEYSPLRPLVDWLDCNGFTMVTKPTKEYPDQTGGRRIKGNMYVELAIDMLEFAPYVDHIVLASGDGDFRRRVDAVYRKRVRVFVISSVRAQPAFIADELRRQADNFIELEDLRSNITGASHGRAVADSGLGRRCERTAS